jgi:deoxycytidylate deaminase
MDGQKYIKNDGFTKLPDLSINFKNIDDEILYFQDPNFYKVTENNNIFMEAAKQAAIDLSLTSLFPIGIVVEKNGQIIARAGNGNNYHDNNLDTIGHRKGCVRRYLNDEREKVGQEKFKSGEGFELCPGCHTDYHAEAKLINESKKINRYPDLVGATVYMYGHFWCCRDCWKKMIEAGIKDVYLPGLAENFRDKEFVKKWVEEVKSKRG